MPASFPDEPELPEVPDEPLADIAEPNATEYDDIANTEDAVPVEDADASDEAEDSGIQDSDFSAFF